MTEPAHAEPDLGAESAPPQPDLSAESPRAEPPLAEAGVEYGLAAVEAILMVAEEPIAPAELAAALQTSTGQVQQWINQLRAEADGQAEPPGRPARRRGYELREIAGGYRYYSRAEYSEQVSAFLMGGQGSRLSSAAWETLAVIAYRQPVSRAQVAAIRGVAADSVVRTLVHRGLVDTDGTDPDTGATLYVTTPLLTEKLGLQSLADLPALSPYLPGVEAAAEYEAMMGEDSRPD